MQKAGTILLVIVGAVVVIGAVLHTILFPAMPIPTWLMTAVASVVAFLFGKKQDLALGAFKIGKKK